MCLWLEVNQKLEVFIVELRMILPRVPLRDVHGSAVRFHGKEGRHE